jgi:hypothetical protein
MKNSIKTVLSVLCLAASMFLTTPYAEARALSTQNLTTAGPRNLVSSSVTTADCLNILSYGGAGDGSTDNTAALNSLLATASGGNACAYFPPGKYKFTANVTYSFVSGSAAITFKGAGSDLTELTWIGTDGITVNYAGPFNSVHVRDVSLTTSGLNAGAGLKLNQTITSYSNPANAAVSDISGVTFRGADGYAASQYWAYGVDVYNVSNVNFINDSFVGEAGSYGTAGVGVNLHGTSSVGPIVSNFTDSFFQWLYAGILYGANTQGVSVAQSNFTGDAYGIYAPANGQVVDQLTVTSSEFNCSLEGVYTLTPISNTIIENSYFIVPKNAVGIDLSSTYSYSVLGNTFEINSGATNTVGLAVNVTAAPSGASGPGGVITGNVFSGLTTGVYLQSASTNAILLGNQYAGNANNFVNSGSNNKIGVATP